MSQATLRVLLDRLQVAGAGGADTLANEIANACPTELYTTLSAAATSLTLSGLNGDVDGDYVIHGRMNSAVGANVLSLLVNGSATNLWWITSNDLIGGVLNASSWTWGQNGAASISWSANDYIEFIFDFRARSGRTRMLGGRTKAIALKGGAFATFTGGGELLNAGSNIQTIALLASQTNGLGIGSFLRAIPVGTADLLSLAPAGAQQPLWSQWADNTIP